ncbi:effector protein [Mesorhizobium erdmanii]|uniref:Effector protein n=2 Tax=Mesorhizobium TaxID=68287 RepID=A0A3M9X0C5_9HYPH|nr:MULTISPECIES: effector protein [Mesorhizobium]RNJ41484.1 effector protein [Mesorhizobium japonicum]RXT53358.1 effector protein [Mesorhizobium erdmanii]
MADIGKKPVKLRNPAYKQARSARREEDQRFRALETAQQALGIRRELERPSKQKRYAKEMDIFDSVEEGYRGEVGYKLIGNKRLRIHKDGERTRKSGIVNRTTEVLKRDPDSGSVYIGRLEKEGWRKKRSYEFDAKGELHSLSRERNDGSFRERWERDETGKLIRTSYFTNRLRDGRIFRPISEEMSAPYESGPDNKKYRILTRRKGSKTEVFERDEDGNLELVGRKAGGFRRYSTKSRDGRTRETAIKSLFGSKNYKSLIDANGNEVGRNIRSHRRLLNKRSATYDEKTNQLTGAKHTFGKMYKSETRYLSNGTKVVSKEILGVKLSTDLKKLTSDESKAREMGAEEAAQHKEAWKNVVVTPKLPSASMTKQLESAVAQLDGSEELSKAHATGDQTRLGSPFVATSNAEHNASNIDKIIAGMTKNGEVTTSEPNQTSCPRPSQTNRTAEDVRELEQIGRKSAIGPDAGQDDLNKPQPPNRQGKFGNDKTFVDNDNGRNAGDANASSKESSNDNLARIRMAAARAQADGRQALSPPTTLKRFGTPADTAQPHKEANHVAAVKPQASNSQSSNDRRMAMIEAAKRRDEAAKRAGLDVRAVACRGRG